MNRTTQDSLARLKELIESRNFGQARRRLIELKNAKNISDEEIKRGLTQLNTDNQAFTEFFNYHERVNSQPPVGPSAPPPLPGTPVGPSAPQRQQFRGTLSTPGNPIKKRSSKKKKSNSPSNRERSSQEFNGTLSTPGNPNIKKNKNKKEKPQLPIIRRRSRKRSRPKSENRNRRTKRRRTE